MNRFSCFARHTLLPACLAASVCTIGHAASPPRYTAQLISTGQYEPSVTVHGLNDLGQVVGFHDYGPFIWDPSAGVRSIPRLHDEYIARPYDINNKGQVTGIVNIDRTDSRAFLYDGQATRDIGSFDGWWLSYGAAVNEAGQVAGMSVDHQLRGRAFIYDGHSMQSLGTLPGFANSRAWALNDRGQVAGTLESAPDSWLFPLEPVETSPMFFSDGTMVALTGPSGETDGEAFDLNNAGQVLVNFRTGEPGVRTAVWDAENGASYLPIPQGYTRSHASDINDAGDVIGSASNSLGYEPFLFTGGKTVDFESLVDADVLRSWDITSLLHLNNRGQVLAGARHLGTNDHRYLLLSPVPEPATWTLLLGGLGLLAWKKRSRAQR